MRKSILLFSFLSASILSFGQTAITIQSSDMPIPMKPYRYDEITKKNPTSPVISNNGSWDYSSYFGNDTSSTAYILEMDTFFTNKGADVFIDGSKAFNKNYIYYTNNIYDFNTNSIDEIGVRINRQPYGIGQISGNNADSLIIGEQKQIFTNPRTIVKFPMTIGSTWNSSSDRETDFNLTVTAYGLINAPAKQKYTIIRTDSVIGWGKLRTFTPGGPTPYEDVLVEKVSQYSIDSFFLNGSPAPSQLLAAFGVAQGQNSNVQNYYNMYRKGSFSYYARFGYTNSMFDTLSYAFINIDSPKMNTAINAIELNTNTVNIYPNPTNGNEINISLNSEGSFDNYLITNLLGKVVQQGKLTPGIQNIPLNSSLTSGTYIISFSGLNQNLIKNQKLYIQK